MKYLLIIIFHLSIAFHGLSQNSVLDSLKYQYYYGELKEVELVTLQNQIAWEFNRVNLDSTHYYASKALDLAKKIEDYPGQARALNLIAIVFATENKVDSSISYNEQALALSLEHDFLNYRSAFLNDLGADYGLKGEHDKQLQYFYDALEAEESLDNNFISYTLGNIASTHRAMGNEEQAEYYFQLALEEAAKSSNKQLIHYLISGQSESFYEMGQLDSALVYSKKAYQIAQDENITISAAWNLTDIAEIYIAKEEYDEAISYLEKLRQHNIAHEINTMNMTYYGLSSAAYKGKKQYDIALAYRLKSKEEIEKNDRRDLMPHILRELSEIYAAKNDYKSAYHSVLEYSSSKDSIFSEDKKRALLEMEVKYQNKQKEKENVLLKQNQKALKRYNNLLVIMIFVLLAFTAITSILLYLRNRSTIALKVKNQELEQLNVELNIAKQKALKASEAKQDFLSRMSHEIRTPLNAVVGFVNILLNEKPRLEQLPYLHHLKSSGKYLIYLINNLLDFSKLEAGKVKIESTSFDLKKALTEMVESFRLNNTNEDLQVLLDVDESLPKKKLIGSPFRLNQILYNLISNAMKFTPNGSVTLRATNKKVEQNQIWIKFEIQDTGIGIPKNRHQKIFESFTQAEDSISQEFGGSGLGLSIVEDLLKLMGSKTEVSSKVGEGSTFSFLLQFTLGKDLTYSDEAPTVSQERNSAKLQGLNILLAEDNLFNQKIATKILDNQGAKVTAVKNGQEALEKIRFEPFDLVLMDLHMPVMDGYEAVKKIRAMRDDISNIPIILLSATTLDPFINKVDEINVDYYIEKPFSPEVLYEAIEKCILNKNEAGYGIEVAVV